MMADANSLDGRKLSLSAQKALRQRVIEAYKKGIKRTQIWGGARFSDLLTEGLVG